MAKSDSDHEIIAFKTPAHFRKWLRTHHAKSPGIWMKLFKKHTGVASITYQESIREALCFGWIDGVGRSLDAESWLQKYTPRRARSIWSKRNTKIVEELIKEKRMHKAGLAQVELAKKDGRWDKAYAAPSEMKVPADFIKELKKFKKAYAFFLTLNKTNLYAIAWRLTTAKKEETRHKRKAAILQMMKDGQKFH